MKIRALGSRTRAALAVLLAGVAVATVLSSPSSSPVRAATSTESTPTADPGSDFQSITVSATSWGIRILPKASLTAGEQVEADIPFAQATEGVGRLGSSIATILWPGELGANLGSTLQVLGNPLPVGPSQLPPAITSLEGNLNDPLLAQAQSGTGPPTVRLNTVPGVEMTATATPSVVTATTKIASTANTLLSIGAGSTTSSLRFSGASKLIATTTSEIHGLTIGGVLSVGLLHSHSHAVTNGHTAHSSGSTHLADIRVAGIPIVVDSSGVHVKGSSVPATALTTVVNTALKTAGLTLSLIKPHSHTDRGSASASPGGLAVTSGKIGQILLGGAQLSVAGTRVIPFSAPPAPSQQGSTTPTTSTASGVLPSGPSFTNPASSGRAPITAAAPAATTAASSLPASGGLGAGWLVGGMLISLLVAAAARRVPVLLVPTRTDHCPAEER